MNDAQFADVVIATLANEGAKDLSDAEIEKALSVCSSPPLMIFKAKELRDKGLINVGLLSQAACDLMAPG